MPRKLSTVETAVYEVEDVSVADVDIDMDGFVGFSIFSGGGGSASGAGDFSTLDLLCRSFEFRRGLSILFDSPNRYL